MKKQQKKMQDKHTDRQTKQERYFLETACHYRKESTRSRGNTPNCKRNEWRQVNQEVACVYTLNTPIAWALSHPHTSNGCIHWENLNQILSIIMSMQTLSTTCKSTYNQSQNKVCVSNQQIRYCHMSWGI